MAKFENSFGWQTRGCTVDGRPGYFHIWEQYSEPVAPSLLVGGHPGGVIAQVFGIVEFSDGVQRVQPYKIKFTDEDSAALIEFEKFLKAKGDNTHEKQQYS